MHSPPEVADVSVHWNAVYRARRTDEMSWYQPLPARSVELLLRSGASQESESLRIR